MDGEEGTEKKGLSGVARRIVGSFRSVRPEFLKKSDEQKATQDSKKSNATGLLEGVEKSAAGGFGKTASNLGGIRKNESKAGGFYSGGGKSGGRKENDKDKKWIRKTSATIAVILTIVISGVAMFGGLSTELVSWKENIASLYGQNSAVMNTRSNYMMRTLLKTNRTTTSDSIFGTKFKISSKLSKKLKSQDIDYVETTDVDGKKLRMLVYKDPDGGVIPIVASENDVSRANTLVGKEIDIDGKKVKLTDASMTLSDAKSKNKNFNKSYDSATITFTGKIAGWFDNVADSMYKRIVGEGARNKTNIDDPDEEKVDKLLLENSSEGAENSEVKAEKEVTDEDGNTTKRPAEASDEIGDGMTYGDIDSKDGKIDVDNSDSVKAEDSAKSALTARAQKVAMMSSTVACGFLRSIGAISTAVGAIQTANVIAYASKYLEIADKIKAGDADEVTNMALNNLNEPVKTTAYDIDGNTVELEGSVASSDGWNTVFSRENIVNEDDPSALMSNREFATKNALHGMSSGLFTDITSAVASFGGGVAAFRICNGVQLVAGLVDGISDVVLAFSTVGIGNFIKEIFKGAIKGAVFSAIMIAVSSVISAITPMVAQWMVSNLSNVFLGKNGGFALLSGSQNILQSNLQMSTGRYADKNNVMEVATLTRDVEDEWAEYERTTKDPFDATSEYTFLGSIIKDIAPVLNSSDNILARVTMPLISLSGSSLLAIMNPSASAANEINKFAGSIASDDNCAYLHSVGVAGDFACNKYAGAYVDELTTMDPDTVYQNMKKYDSFDGEDSDGNPKINKNSDYAKYIVACVTSDTQPGTMNSAVEGFIEGMTETGDIATDALINFGSNFVPFSGFLDSVTAGEQEANFKWNSGLACTGNTDDSLVNEEVRNFSMYNLDQRVLNEMGVIDTNSTVSFLDEYYEDNPIDNSFEGKISRFSGLTKEEVSDVLALVEYYNYIANYNPSERYAFGMSAVEVKKELRFDDENSVAENVWGVLADAISYADVRNRSFAV